MWKDIPNSKHLKFSTRSLTNSKISFIWALITPTRLSCNKRGLNNSLIIHKCLCRKMVATFTHFAENIKKTITASTSEENRRDVEDTVHYEDQALTGDQEATSSCKKLLQEGC